MFLLYQTFKKNAVVAAAVILLLSSPGWVNAQSQITTIEVSETHSNKFASRSEDAKITMGPTTRPYIIFGTDFNGAGGFFISFNLETRQTVQYQLVDMMGRQIAAQDLREVLDQTYRVQANSVSSGAYIVRLVVNRTCYSEKIFFTP
jgi:hypothetical protein